ncbi:MAG: serine/threonine protein kinase [Gemmatimonadetes bacterium]|nr:serine/threonine protein kinase [Gemmatimonadota bacterium]
MSGLPDSTLRHLQDVAERPDLSGTRYEIVERIGRGGMGTVYRAHDESLDRDVALKVLTTAATDAAFASRMLREARILARLEHPGIVPVHDVGRLPDGRVWYSMKLVRGARLDVHVGTATELPERLRLFLRICDAVAFAHAHGVIHRDLKPANVMVGPFGEVLVLDWGVAKVMDESAAEAETHLTQVEAPGDDDPAGADPEAATAAAGDPDATRPGTVLGTPGFMAPEQARGRPDLVDHRSDVYALGGILAGLMPPGGGAARPLEAIRARAQAAEPDDRYPSVEDLSRDVLRFLDDRAVAAYSEGAWERVTRFARKYRTPLLLILAYLIARAAIFFWAGT